MTKSPHREPYFATPKDTPDFLLSLALLGVPLRNVVVTMNPHSDARLPAYCLVIAPDHWRHVREAAWHALSKGWWWMPQVWTEYTPTFRPATPGELAPR